LSGLDISFGDSERELLSFLDFAFKDGDRTVPGIGEILAPLVWLEIGDVKRFPRAESLASYVGLVQRIIASGGRIRHGGIAGLDDQNGVRGPRQRHAG
jgi:Transposase IS116/IS110/IS902 family